MASLAGQLACVSWALPGVPSLGWVTGDSSGKSHTSEDVLISEGDITFHLFSELHYAPCQKAWLALSRQIGFFHPKLEGFGIGHCLLPPQFSDVPAGEFGGRQWQKTLLMKAWWCQWGLVVILNPVPLADPSGELERGPHLLCQFLMVIYSRNLSQFLQPARHVCIQALQVTQLSNSATGGSGEDILLSSSSKLSAGPWRKQLTSGPNSGGASKSKSMGSSLFSLDSRPLQGGQYSK